MISASSSPPSTQPLSPQKLSPKILRSALGERVGTAAQAIKSSTPIEDDFLEALEFEMLLVYLNNQAGDFGQVHDLEGFFQTFGLGGIVQHLGAVGAGHGQDLGPGSRGLLNPDPGRAVRSAAQDLGEEIAAAPAAAQGIGPGALQLDQLQPGYGARSLRGAWYSF